MKHLLFQQSLKILRSMAERVQIGNPAGKAPALAPEPGEEEKVNPALAIEKNIFVWQLHNTLCCGLYSGAIINEHNQVYKRFTAFPWGRELHPGLCSPYLGRKLASLKKAVFLMTPGAKGNYYHWIADLLPRLLLVQKSGLADFDERWIVLHQPGRRYESDTLSLLGIEEERVIRLHPFETLGVKDLIVADYLHSRDGQSFPLWKRQLLDEFKQKVLGPEAKKGHRKIYLLRGHQRTRRLIGEERLVAGLKALEFEILDPQHLSLAEQMQALSEAKVVVALHGAALVNIIFCPQGTHVIELRSSYKPPEHYSEIAKTYNLRFESLTLKPEKVVEKPHLALQQNLYLLDEHIDALTGKFQMCEV